MIREAVDLRRKLTANRPDVFNSDLARSLHNLSLRLSDLGYCQRALEVIQEAVNLHWELAIHRPSIFNSVSAISLDELSWQLTNLGHSEQALEALHEAAIIRDQRAAV
jgi:hypothetical protein